MNENKIKVLVVDDSALMRRIIQDILEQDPEICVVGVARDGSEALKKAEELNPEVITLDIEMPVMDGISCLESLQKQGSYGIILVSGVTKAGTTATIQALELGAFDFIEKTDISFDMSSGSKRTEIIEKVKLAYRTLKKTEKLNKCRNISSVKRPVEPHKTDLKYIVALGISTGGPKSLSTILPELPADLPAAIVIVQHMPPGFTRSLAERLNESCSIYVKEAEDNDILEAGNVYIAPGDYHLTFSSDDKNTRIKLTKTPPVGSFRPSVDVMMGSLAESNATSIIGVIMTGMGSDGSKGLLELKKKKDAFIIAQDESTSIVFGMPRSAIDLGIVDKIVPLKKIPSSLMDFMGVHE
jgi:two-component system chemotaxis response regulator CheB